MSSCKSHRTLDLKWEATLLTQAAVKQFIRNVRASKTIADERAVVQKESAAIRASFREESHDSNLRSVNPEFQSSLAIVLIRNCPTGGIMLPNFFTFSP